jgi:GT2 family glycosyltransferase
MKLSILISSYNGKNDIGTLLDSIKRNEIGNHEIEVIIRDDKSADITPDVIAQEYPWVTLIRGEENVGFAKSNNIAFSYATGDVICCLNQDTKLERNFLLEGLSLLEQNQRAVGLNTNMIMPWVMSLEEFSEKPVEDFPAYEYQLTRYGFVQYVQVDPVARETDFMTGGGFFLRRSALEEGEELFDPRIRMYCEDTELSMRLTERGCILLYAPKAVIYHNQIAKRIKSLNELKKLFMVTWNRFLVLSLHHRPLSLASRYILYLWGITRKMGFLGISEKKMRAAYIASIMIALFFLFLLPYWLMRSSFSSS